jgi:anti-sigma factor RsiW
MAMSKMDLARFETLVAAYGATPNRWPAEERDAAEAFARSDARAAALLAEADAIDALLFAHRVPEPTRTLRAMVIESAPKKRRLAGRARLWWTGLGLALAGASGMLAGSAATAALEPVSANVQMYSQDVPALDYSAEENSQ